MVARATARRGSCDSAAAMVAISAPVKKATAGTTPVSTAPRPWGAKPPSTVRLASPGLGVSPSHRPSRKQAPSRMKAQIAAILIEDSQYSNSPNERADTALLSVRTTISARLSAHSGTDGSQASSRPAPATASTATTMTQKYQYSQPMTKPARSPSPSRAYS